MNGILHKIYYDEKNPAGYSSAEKLFKAAQKVDVNISRDNVNEWLSKQLAYTLHKPARRRFKRNKIIVEEIDEQWEADLVEMQEFASKNAGYRYILTVIDSFSKFGWAMPLKAKTSKEVVTAFKKIFESRQPEKLRTDKGKEFLNTQMNKLLKELDVVHITSKDDTIKCAIIERFNRTLKSRMYKYFTAKGTRKYIDVLQRFIDAYNHSIHRSTKFKPSEVNEQNKSVVFYNLYGVKSVRELLLNKKTPAKLSADQDIRVKYKLKPFDKSFYPNWTDHIYKVKSLNTAGQRPFYKIVDNSGNPLEKRYYPEEVQKVTPDLHRVEKVIKRRKRQGKTEYFVKWLNYPDSYNSWIPSEDLLEL